MHLLQKRRSWLEKPSTTMANPIPSVAGDATAYSLCSQALTRLPRERRNRLE
jgi:hypothetical protein